MKTHNMEQGSPEWHDIRRGKFTASNFHLLFQGKTTKGYLELIDRVVYERLTGVTPESFTNEWMERGKQLESEALFAYELETGNKVECVGFIELNEWTGCSPDGLVDNDGMVQVKCPKWTTMMDYWWSWEVPQNYTIQVQSEMFIAGRAWSDLYFYHPGLRSIKHHILADIALQESIKKELDIAIAAAIFDLQRLKEKMK